VEVILRLLLAKHLYQWSYQETLERVSDSLVLRWFSRVYFQRVPDESTLIRWAHTLRPETLHALNDRVVQLAAQAKVTKGRKLRVDATCVQTNIHHPTDSGLLVDSVRVLSRLVQRAKPLLKEQLGHASEIFRSRLRSARRVAQSLHRLRRRKSEIKEEEQQDLYRRLITTTEHMVQQAKQVMTALAQRSDQAAQRLLTSTQEVLPLIRRVIHQAQTRVLEGKQVESREKVLSLHEPHTRVIPRHKGGALVEFGRFVVFDEVEGGMVTRYQIISDGESDRGQAGVALAHHQPLGWRIRPGCWLEIEASMPKRPRDPSRLSGGPSSIHDGGSGPIAGGRGLKGASTACAAIMAYGNARITGKWGWNAGLGWGFWPAICAISPRRSSHKAQPGGDRTLLRAQAQQKTSETHPHLSRAISQG